MMKRIIIAILSFFILPIVSFAVSNVNYDITHYYIKAKVQENGDLKVKELIVLDGSFNGYEKTIYLASERLNRFAKMDFEHSSMYNPQGISDLKVSAKYLGSISYSNIDDDDYEEFSVVDSASQGDKRKLVYVYDNSDKVTFRMYYESVSRKVGFLIEYTLKDFVVLHNDVGELYWQIITGDSYYNDDVDDIITKVYLPGKDSSGNFKVWGHGPLYGKVDNENDNTLLATVSSLDKSEDYDVRLTFDKSLLDEDLVLKKSYVDGLDEIVKVETKRADEANKTRERLRKIYDFCDIATKTLITINIFGLFVLIFKYGIKPRTNFYAKYYREFIEDYPVEVVDFLYTKNVSPKALSAGIMNLVYNKVCKVEEMLDANTKKKNKDYKFILLNREGLNENDEKLVSFLFDTVGNGEEFTTVGLKSYASSLKTGSKFESGYRGWTNIIKKLGNKQDFYKSKLFGGVLCFILLMLSILLIVYASTAGADVPLLALPFIIVLADLTYLGFVKAYNEKGALHIKKWNAFKNFLNDFGTFDIKELPEIALWERYLVYATVFGLAKKVQRDIEVKIKELELQDTTITNTYSNLYVYDSINRSFSTAVTEGKRTYAASRANAYSSHSSGGGFGGGFSSGGGFGGGGGGGHGF